MLDRAQTRSGWTIATRSDIPVAASEAVEWLAASGHLLLDIYPLHAAGVEKSPAIQNDPVDRLPVAQALAAHFGY